MSTASSTSQAYLAHQVSRERPRNAEAEAVVAKAGREPLAEGETGVARVVVPGSATEDPAGARLGPDWIDTGARQAGVLSESVPEPHIAAHVVESPGGACPLSNRIGLAPAVVFVPSHPEWTRLVV